MSFDEEIRKVDASSTSAAESLRESFASPPNSARPLLNWTWLNGNVSKEGIRKDLEWAARVGAAGVNIYELQMIDTPQVVEKRLVFGSDEWKDAIRYAAALASCLGLEFGISSSAGYSGSTGGPWVPPTDGMKKLVWSELALSGGERFSDELPAPPITSGPFQSLPADGDMVLEEAGVDISLPTFYRDEAVIAFPVDPRHVLPMPDLCGSDGRKLDASLLNDDDFDTGIEIRKTVSSSPGHIDISYPQPQTVTSVTLFVADYAKGPQDYVPRFQVLDRTGEWRTIADIPPGKVPTTIGFEPTTSSRFRLLLSPKRDPGRYRMFPAPGAVTTTLFPAPPPSNTIRITQLRLTGEVIVHRFESKAGFDKNEDRNAPDDSTVPDLVGVPVNSIIDLTDRMTLDGKLDWLPPPGQWRVLRFGYSLTGKLLHPATPEATGLHVDAYDREAVRRSFSTYLSIYEELLEPTFPAGSKRWIWTDSNESNPSNWTTDLRRKFAECHGYDLRPWMPALAGYAVGSRSDSNAFLSDFRRTLSKLVATEHYGELAAVARERSFKIYTEALEWGAGLLGDDMAMRSYADAAAGAMFYFPRGSVPYSDALFADLKGAASVAHVYGKELVMAESLTAPLAPWALAPADLKRIADLEFSHGVNRLVIYLSVHEPRSDVHPGLRASCAGSDFNRLESWAELARPWMDYLARTSYLLQQGRDVADIAYFYGEDTPLVGVFRHGYVSDVPKGYGFDFVGEDALLNHLSAEKDALVSRGGARYRVLYLGCGSQRMSLPVLHRLAELAEAGVAIVGNPPVQALGLNHDRSEFDSLVRRLWSDAPAVHPARRALISGQDLEQVLRALQVPADLLMSGDESLDIGFQHRNFAQGAIDTYYLSNRRNRPEGFEASFRVKGKKPAIWRPETGRTEAVTYRIENGRTIIPLRMHPEESYFIVFDKPSERAGEHIPLYTWTPAVTIDGPWEVAFQTSRGAPSSVKLQSLQWLSTHDDPGVRYFSGVATYRAHFDMRRTPVLREPLKLALGGVGDVAEVHLNGQLLGTVWAPPYEIEVSGQMLRDVNELEIRVANLWVNRLIGDAQPDAVKVTSTSAPVYRADAPLRPSGLVGPVLILQGHAPADNEE